MAFKLGNTTINDVKLGNTQVNKIYRGNDLVWQKSGGGAFTPNDVPNIIGWWDASDLITITSSGNKVSQWNDKSANSRNLTQSNDSYKPITGVETLNSLNVLGFNGLQTVMDVPSLTTGTNQIDMFLVIKADTDDVSQTILGSNTNNSFLGIASNTASTEFYRNVGTPIFNVDGGSIESPTTRQNLFDLYINNTPRLLTISNVQASSIDLLGKGNSSTFLHKGYIAEIIMYQNTISIANKNLIGNYLKNKWGITWTNVS